MQKSKIKIKVIENFFKKNFQFNNFSFFILNLKFSKAQRGSIIIFTVLLLTTILAITLALTRIFIPRIRSITEATDSVGAIYAADSAMEWCLYSHGGKIPSLPQPTMSNDATYQIYREGAISVCPSSEALNYRTVGTFRGVNRSFEVSEL